MWIFSKKQKAWVNLNNALRISKKDQEEYVVACSDGVKLTIDKETYDYAMKFVDPEYYDKQEKAGCDAERMLKAIMKATGAKVEEETKDTGDED